ncbi:hypothetical protein ACET3Z_030114 [Daucus carota]
MASAAATSSLVMKLLLVLVGLLFISHMVQLTSHETSFSPSLATRSRRHSPSPRERRERDCEDRTLICGSSSPPGGHG